MLTKLRCRSCSSVATIHSITSTKSRIHAAKSPRIRNIKTIYEKSSNLGEENNDYRKSLPSSIKTNQFTNPSTHSTMSNKSGDSIKTSHYTNFMKEILKLENCDFSDEKKENILKKILKNGHININENIFSNLKNLCMAKINMTVKIREFNFYVKNLIENENEKNNLKELLFEWHDRFLNKNNDVKQINEHENNLRKQFSKYEEYNDLSIAISESSSILNKINELKPVVSFLLILQFCATIKHSFKLYQIKEYVKSLMIYCKYYVLPEAREILNYAKIEYKFGKFAIKIDKENEKLLKMDDWLVEEEEVKVEEKIEEKEKIKVVKPKPLRRKEESNDMNRLETIIEDEKEGKEENEEEE